MPRYAILQNPGHNRVYFKTARQLALLELSFAGRRMSAPPEDAREELVGGLPYILFDTDSRLTDADIRLLSRLSFVYGIFEWESKGALLPLEKAAAYYFESDDITTILKYNGKTNELFTRLMLNIAVLAGGNTDCLHVLDPLCGKGTSLFEALLNGYSVSGVESDSKMLQESYNFLKKYLENARYKHTSHQERQGMKDYNAQRYQLTLSRDKTDKNPLTAELIAGDTRDMAQFFRKNTFDAIIGDLPYGVQHGSKGGKTESRNALPLLKAALPGWHKVLKPGAALVLAWNLFLIDRDEMEDALESGGFEPDHSQRAAFVHRVDQAIKRDLIVAIKVN